MAYKYLFVAAILASSACSKSSSDPSRQGSRQQEVPSRDTVPPGQDRPLSSTSQGQVSPEAAGGWYRAELEKTGEKGLAPIPFFLRVPPAGGQGKAVIRSGPLDIEVEYAWLGARLAIRLPMFKVAFQATMSADGALEGTWLSEQKTWWGKASLAFRARPVAAPDPALLFPASEGASAQAAEVGGVWRLSMGDASISKLILETKPGKGVVGTYISGGASIVHMAGTISGDRLQLSAFDGSLAFLLTATVSHKTIKGTFTAVRHQIWREEFTGEHVDDFEHQTGAKLVEGEKTLEIPGVDLGAYKGKPTIVEITGSWCTNCMYAAPFMAEMYAKYHARGLEMVTLLYEFTDDADYNRKQAEITKQKYGMIWEVIPVTGEAEEASDILPPNLDDIDLSGLPITVFIGRDGTIQHLHSGFPGRGTELYNKITAQFEKWIQELMGA